MTSSCLILLLLTCASCSNASCSNATEENSTSPSTRIIRHNAEQHTSYVAFVFNIRSASAPSGVTNKNAGDVQGDLNFIFGSPGESGASARGCYRYYNSGIVSRNYVTIFDPMGAYQHCNHDSRGKYTCDGNTPNAGYQHDTHTGGFWYSFPSSGEGKYWSLTDYFGHVVAQDIEASQMIQSIGKAARCDCSSISVSRDSCSSCAKCVMAVVARNPESIEKAWMSSFQSSLTNETSFVV